MIVRSATTAQMTALTVTQTLLLAMTLLTQRLQKNWFPPLKVLGLRT